MKHRDVREWLRDAPKESEEELRAELAQLRDRLYTLRTQAVTEKVEDNSQFRSTRRQIARVLTELNSRAAAAGSDG